MIELRDAATNRVIGSIDEQQLQFLMDQLEEESVADKDYYINRDTLDMFEQKGADPELLRVLRETLGSREEMEIKWSRK